ncbi:hypothetical protein TNIN_164461 [Trichonephila inaurata madagascariensis]|uniref:Ig-like domain-containing protein n=1 Tax=Trichonephila inaurata madagascariensis TaxID=2747483 RepID=A0A8X6Y3A5_9ARAC|nr:hypothetical protein TNIN_164461 [Trichonephila inaurata madagascariensis]
MLSITPINLPISTLSTVSGLKTEECGFQWITVHIGIFENEQANCKEGLAAKPKNLRASVYPEKLIVKEGISVTFTCNVTGPQITSLVWTKNLKPVITSARTKLISSEVLQIYSVMREDKGMYQCFVRSHDYSYQGSAQLSLEVLKTNVQTMKQLHCLTIGEADKELTNKQGGHEIPRGNKAPEFHYRE